VDHGRPSEHAAKRRTFAIISHPDAGKTTLTEKLLLYAGMVAQAGSVKARSGRREVTSDWMDMERERGISITSAALQFTYRDHVVNLLDTPGHRDFSEDTYRTLTAADAAVMVLDTAKGIEAQTLKLFEVARDRGMPLLTFLNKYDRPGKDPLELLDEIEQTIGVKPTPVTWPVGIPGDLRGVIDRRDGSYTRFTRTARGATAAPEEVLDASTAAEQEGEAWEQAEEEAALLAEIGADFDQKTFLAGETTPLFVGSAITNFGVRHLLDGIIDLAPPPTPRDDVDGVPRPLDDPFAGFVFKVQANMDPSHRDRIAFVRVCSGRFERGMTVTQATSGKPFSTKYASSVFGADRESIDEAWPGDVIGLVNATELRVGDSLHDPSSPVTFPPIPAFSPEVFAAVRPLDTGRAKQFRRGIEQLGQEGVVQVLTRADGTDPTPVVAGVGRMQFEVLAHRLEHEFGAKADLSPTSHSLARRTDAASAEQLAGMRGIDVFKRSDGVLLALFENQIRLQRLESDQPELVLDAIVTS
jgi:peptide chain release factor 3